MELRKQLAPRSPKLKGKPLSEVPGSRATVVYLEGGKGAKRGKRVEYGCIALEYDAAAGSLHVLFDGYELSHKEAACWVDDKEDEWRCGGGSARTRRRVCSSRPRNVVVRRPTRGSPSGSACKQAYPPRQPISRLQWHPTDGYPLAHPAARLLVGRGCHDSVQSCTV